MDKNKRLLKALEDGKIVDEKSLALYQILDDATAEVDRMGEIKQEVEKKVDEVGGKIEEAFNSISEKVSAEIDQKVASIEVEDGKDYVLTEDDKAEIAGKITVPVVEKVIERVVNESPNTEMVVEQTTQSVMEKVMPLIPTMEGMMKDMPKMGEMCRDGLELIQEEEDKLKIDSIGFLRKELDELKKTLSSRLMGQGAGGGARGRVHPYDLTDQCNGVLKTFAIPTNFGVIGVFSTQFPVNYRPLVDWTLGNKTITLTSQVSAPETGQTLWIMYIK